MLNNHIWQPILRCAAFGLIAGVLLGSGPAALGADEDQPAARKGTPMTAPASRPDCDATNGKVLAARYLEKGPRGVRLITEKCTGADEGIHIDDVGSVEGTCDNPSKCGIHGDKITVEIELPKSELEMKANEQVERVISSVIVQVGESTCYWYCTGSGGSQSCEKLCD